MYVVIELKRFYEHNSVSHGIYFESPRYWVLSPYSSQAIGDEKTLLLYQVAKWFEFSLHPRRFQRTKKLKNIYVFVW